MRAKLRGWALMPVMTAIIWTGRAAAEEGSLIAAIKARDKPAIASMLKDPGAVSEIHGDGSTALHWAVLKGDLDTAKALLHSGADVNAGDKLGVTPLSLGCLNADLRMVQILLTAGANVNVTRKSGETPLMTAAWTGSADILKLLLAHKARIDATESVDKQTALMWAVSEKHPEAVRVLVDAGANVHARSSLGFTPILFAARAGNVESAQILLDAGSNIDDVVPQPSISQSEPKGRESYYGRANPAGSPCNSACGGANSAGASVLVVAVVSGHVALAKMLLERGADPNADGTGYTALHWAAGKWETSLTGANGIKPHPGREWAALAGIPHGKMELMKALLDHGADPNARLSAIPPRYGLSRGSLEGLNLLGATPFFLAAYAADVNAMELLAEHGADASITLSSPQPSKVAGHRLRDHSGTTPLMAAAGLGRVAAESTVTEAQALEAVKFALKMGNDLNAANKAGDTALHGAARSRANSIVQYLVDAGAAISVKNKQGQTPLMAAENLAQFAGRDDLTERSSTGDLLRKLGAT